MCRARKSNNETTVCTTGFIHLNKLDCSTSTVHLMEVYTDSTLIYTHRSHLQSKVHLPIYNSVVIGSKKCLIAFQYRVSFTSYELQVMCVVRLVQIWYNSSHLVQLIGVGTQQALVQIRNWLVVNIQQYLTVPVATLRYCKGFFVVGTCARDCF